MRIVFSVFKESIVTETKEKVWEELVETALPIRQIDVLSGCNDGFSSVLSGGKTLAFWDIVCFQGQEQDIIGQIRRIPRTKIETEPEEIEPSVILVSRRDPGNADGIAEPDFDRCYYYFLSRFECGASGFGEIIAFAEENPILTGILTGVAANALWNGISIVKERLFGKRKAAAAVQPERYTLDVKSLNRNFSQLTKIKKADFQVIDLRQKRWRKYQIQIRAVDNRLFDVTALASGRILSLRQAEEKR